MLFRTALLLLLAGGLLLGAGRTARAQPAPRLVGTAPADTTTLLPARPNGAVPDSAFLRVPGLLAVDSLDDGRDEGTNYRRLAVIGVPVTGAAGVTYFFLQDAWWANQSRSFHIDRGKEFRYAANLDKVAHLFGGAFTADLLYDALRWSYMPEEKAYRWAAVLATSTQVIVEVKDGFSPRWGFGMLDAISGGIGSMYPYLQSKVPILADTDFKFGYWRRSDIYYEVYEHASWINDYVNQTYWLSHNVNGRLPASVEPYWPDFLALAVGVSVDEGLNRPGAAPRAELYLSLDVDLVELLPDGGPAWQKVKRYLNYLKLPTPTLRLTPSVRAYAFYF